MQIPIKLLRANEANYALTPDQIKSRQSDIDTQDAFQLDGMNQVLRRRKTLEKVAPENLDIAFERYVGNNDLLPINYLEIGYQKSKSVGRIRYFDKTIGKNALATGFLISPDLVITNHHVFQSSDSFENPFIEFDYAYGEDGKEEQKIVFALDPKKFFFSYEQLDFTIIGVNTSDESSSHKIAERGYLVLDPDIGKAGVGDFATIIQYPDGDYQQIALRENKVLDISNPNALIYSTDTSNGSSGSAVFNDQWQVIALHSAGVANKDANGNYIDAQGNIIPVVNGTIDSAQIDWVSNTGMRISAIVKYLSSVGFLASNPLIRFLFNSGYSDAKALADSASTPLKPVNHNGTMSTIVDHEALNLQTSTTKTQENMLPVINININIGGQPVDLSTNGVAKLKTEMPASKQTERKNGNGIKVEDTETKADDELNMDYSQCNGFDEYFMGFKTPLPSISDRQLQRQVATFTDNPNEFVLKYYHYSTIQHSIRKVPIVSAINVDGSPDERLDTTARVDKWLRDNRIDFNAQLTDAWYSGSHFDKGHMSRREDAKWGDNAKDAEEAAQLTCMYTNACPQVPDINRAVYGYHGLWGELEQIVLEQGVEKEDGQTTKICVYNGPIFVNTDPTRQGVQTALRFFKIVTWLNDAGERKATGFVLSQEDLVGGIQFEELQFDKEFKEHQCSIAFIESLTGLKFDGIRDYDTAQNPGDPHEVKVVNRQDVENLIQHHSGKKYAEPVA